MKESSEKLADVIVMMVFTEIQEPENVLTRRLVIWSLCALQMNSTQLMLVHVRSKTAMDGNVEHQKKLDNSTPAVFVNMNTEDITENVSGMDFVMIKDATSILITTTVSGSPPTVAMVLYAGVKED